MDLDEALRERGYRVTRPRRMVWAVLSDVDGHLSAPEIAERVHDRDPGVNVSSVYRALTLFDELGLVRESHLADGASTWETAHDDAVIHLVCATCGDVRHHDAVLVEDLRRQLVGVAGFRADTIDVRVSGRCRDCAGG